MSVVYLLHFSHPIAANHTCRHYIGVADDLGARIAQHRAGTGARLTQVAKERGIGFVVARIWEDGDRTLERRLKDRHEGPRLCPICNRAHDDQLDLFTSFTMADVEELAF